MDLLNQSVGCISMCTGITYTGAYIQGVYIRGGVGGRGGEGGERGGGGRVRGGGRNAAAAAGARGAAHHRARTLRLTAAPGRHLARHP